MQNRWNLQLTKRSPLSQVVLKAVKDENPNLRYLAGNDVEQWLGSKRNMSDEEFHKMMAQNFNIHSYLK